MELGAVIVKPSHSRSPNFQGYNLSEAVAEFPCSSCSSSIEINFGSFLRRERLIDENQEAALQALFKVPKVGKSHDGGWPRFDRVACQKCGSAFIVYIGANETSNSVYAFTLQGVVEIVARIQL